MSYQIKISGLKKVSNKLNKINKGLNNGSRGVITKLGEETARIAKALAPKGDTLALINSISFKLSGKKGGWKSAVTMLPQKENPNYKGEVVNYGAMINRGTVRSSPKSYYYGTWGNRTGAVGTIGFFNRAFDYAYEKYPREMKRLIGRIIR